MRDVEPQVFLIARPSINLDEIARYLREIGASEWLARFMETPPDERPPDAQTLIEVAGRGCYRSWQPGLNPNVTKVRTDQDEYLANIIAVGHGSVLEHAQFSFILHNVSRVFTHEMVRHRAGTAISQESMRYVRLDDLPIWTPEWAQADWELMERNAEVAQVLEAHQRWMAEHFGLDAVKVCDQCGGEGSGEIQLPDGDEIFGVCDHCKGNGMVAAVPMQEKKAKTSYMRRWAPDGVATMMTWSANIRAIRHIISMRTATDAEEEIRIVGDRVADLMQNEAPSLFADYLRDADGAWKTEHWKV